ncbi:hypothetical protein [Sphingomonas sp.]|uniref:hypothetical protein n=1 Tax=Sphingomonas sp. TaxID=28214 RepID=UPI003CC506A4
MTKVADRQDPAGRAVQRGQIEPDLAIPLQDMLAWPEGEPGRERDPAINVAQQLGIGAEIGQPRHQRRAPADPGRYRDEPSARRRELGQHRVQAAIMPSHPARKSMLII